MTKASQGGPAKKWTPDAKAAAIEQILARVATSRDSISTICEENAQLPDAATFFAWKRYDEYIDRDYARAKADQADFIVEEMMDIADDGRNDWMEKRDAEGAVTGYQLNGEHVQRSKLRIETMKWTAGKLRPKRYGDFARTEITGAEGGPIEVALANRLSEARKRAAEARISRPDSKFLCADATDPSKFDKKDGSDE